VKSHEDEIMRLRELIAEKETDMSVLRKKILAQDV